MLRAPARFGGYMATGSIPCTRLFRWTQGRAGSRAHATGRGRPKPGPRGTGVQERLGDPGADAWPGPGCLPRHPLTASALHKR